MRRWKTAKNTEKIGTGLRQTSCSSHTVFRLLECSFLFSCPTTLGDFS
jgi:hypothetical protein